MSHNPFQTTGVATHPSQLQNAYPSSQSSALSQAQAMAQLNQYAQQARERGRWMIDGQAMTFKEFADTLFPENTAERTMFYLKYSKDEE